MSYILDALKKAEAERQHGAVPNLYAQPASGLAMNGAAPRTNRRIAIIVAILLGTALSILAWFKPWTAASPVDRPAPAAATIATAAATTEAARMTTPAISPPSPAIPAPVAAASANTAANASPPAEIVAIAPAPKKKPSASSRHSSVHAAPKPVTVVKADPKPNRDSDIAANLPRSLPDRIRQEAPSLNIGGYIYSENPAERQLLVNKRLMHEGQEVAPGLMLEKMLPHAAVFNYKGYRYQVAY